MTLYSLVLIVHNVTGGFSDFVIDYNLTAEDCESLQIDWRESGLDYHSQVYCETQTEILK